jgi:hypothetical protein
MLKKLPIVPDTADTWAYRTHGNGDRCVKKFRLKSSSNTNFKDRIEGRIIIKLILTKREDSS